MIIHDSSLSEFRSPLGALRTSEGAILRLYVEDEKLENVRIRFYVNDVAQDYEMQYRNGYYSYCFKAPPSPVVVWYCFVFERGGETLFYCPKIGQTQLEGEVTIDPRCYQLTVFANEFNTPSKFRNGRMYQIFPDRFADGDPDQFKKGVYYHMKMNRTVVMHKDFNDPILYTPLDGEEYYSPCDFYGGNLRGIINALPDFANMAINIIYLNPIFEAASNHRYNTADYMNIDPILGSNEDFAELCSEAKKYGIKIILDGVFSHTGSDSRYFNKNGVYDTVGAYQGEDSPFYDWYTFFGDKDHYKTWWGFDTLPETNESNEKWIDFVITGADSVINHWLNLGASGFRLDVADELPDETITLIRKAIKKHNSENLLIGEVWEDATTKHSYGVNRRYALGEGLDSVMNYPFRTAIIDYLKGGSAKSLAAFLVSQRLNYPLPMYYALMNLVSSHDVPRLRTILATGLDGEGMSREEQAALKVTAEQDNNGKRLQRLAGVLQYVIPGIPSLYYGDEYGMHGLKDPFNRAPLKKSDHETAEFFKWLSVLRKNNSVLKTGDVSFFAVDDDVIAILRLAPDTVDCFGSPILPGAIVTFVNRSKMKKKISVPVSQFKTCLEKRDLSKWNQFIPSVCIDMQTQIPELTKDGILEFSINETSFRIFHLH